MSQDFHRQVVGYNHLKYESWNGTLAAYNTHKITIANVPGELDGFIIYYQGSAPTSYNYAGIKLIIDDIPLFDGWLRDFLGNSLNNSFHTMFSTNDVQANGTVTSSYRLSIPYTTSADIIIRNDGPAEINITILVPYHYGV